MARKRQKPAQIMQPPLRTTVVGGANRTSTQQEIRNVLKELLKTLTQTEVAQRLGLYSAGVYQSQISQLYRGLDIYRDGGKYDAILRGLRAVLADQKANPDRTVDLYAVEDANQQLEQPTFAKWLSDRLALLDVTEREVADEALINPANVTRIISGETITPQRRTRAAIEKAIKKIAKRKRINVNDIAGITMQVESTEISPLSFTTSEINLVPATIGVYVIHDARGYPMYIGKGILRQRLGKRKEMADFANRRIAPLFSYYEVPKKWPNGDALTAAQRNYLAKEIEKVLIRFSANAVSHNSHHQVTIPRQGKSDSFEE